MNEFSESGISVTNQYSHFNGCLTFLKKIFLISATILFILDIVKQKLIYFFRLIVLCNAIKWLRWYLNKTLILCLFLFFCFRSLPEDIFFCFQRKEGRKEGRERNISAERGIDGLPLIRAQTRTRTRNPSGSDHWAPEPQPRYMP